MRVFIDTSAFIAVLNAGDQFHPAAKDTWQELLQGQNQIICNNYVLVETSALLGNRFGLGAVRLFQNDILPVLHVFWIDEEMHKQAVSALLAASLRRLSLVDCTCFETMRHLGLSRAFVFNPHYAEYGFETIPQ